MLPFSSISLAPYALNRAPCVSVASLLVLPPMPRPNVRPSCFAISAYLRNASHVQPSCAATCSGFTGYIETTSSPFFLNHPMRPHGGLVCVPELLGTAVQCPCCLARYSAVAFTAPYLPVSSLITSSTGASESWLL